MDVYSVLKNDHDRIRSMFSEFMEKKGQAGMEMFSLLKNRLDAHMKAEESFFYPVLEQERSTHEPALESIEEHHVTRLLLEELEGLSLSDEHWMPKMKVLKEVTEHHLEEEESTIFEQARKAVNEQQAQDIGQAVGKTIQ